MARKTRWPRRIRYRVEGIVTASVFVLVGLLPVSWASAFGAGFAGVVGPMLPVHKLGIENISRALPELSSAEVKNCARSMWCQLGRVGMEYPHLTRFVVGQPGGRIELVGREFLEEAKCAPEGGIFISGHIGNWEIAGLAPQQAGIPITAVYRAANNPIVDRLFRRYRGVQHLVPKGSGGARELVNALKSGKHIALLVDQKQNDGIPVPFFGREAMTTPTLASLALKYKCPVWPIRVERLSGIRFRVTAYPRLSMPTSGTQGEKIEAIMSSVNSMLEGWIRERPDQWLWLHNRWPRFKL